METEFYNYDKQYKLYNKLNDEYSQILFSQIHFSEYQKYIEYLIEKNNISEKILNDKINVLKLKYNEIIKSDEDKNYFIFFKINMLNVFIFYHYNLQSKLSQNNDTIISELLYDIYYLSYLTMKKYLDIFNFKFINQEIKNCCLMLFYYINEDKQNIYIKYKYLLQDEEKKKCYDHLINLFDEINNEINDLKMKYSNQNKLEFLQNINEYLKDDIINDGLSCC